MNNKAFMSLVVGVLVLGAAIGGSFMGGIAVGKGQTSESGASENVLTLPPPGGAAAPALESSDGAQSLAQLREQVQAGEASQESLAQLRQQFQGQFGAGGQGGGFGGGGTGGRLGLGGGLTGTVEAVEIDKITINTAEGTLEVTIGPDTVVQRTEVVTLTLDELVQGLRLTVAGERNDAGVLEAATIFVVPEGAAGPGGFGGFGGRRPGGGGFGGQ